MSRRFAGWLVVSGLFTACGVPNVGVESAASSQAAPIINGTKITTLPAVGCMAYESFGGYETNCTGTLIAPRKVLTAAHCIDPQNPYVFVTGADINNPVNIYTVVSQKAHPSYKGDTYDVGILTLDRDALEAPMLMNQSMDATWVSRNIYWVGYGVTNANTQGGSGYKRAVTIPISAVDPLTFDFQDGTKNTCFGDSGGPGFYIDGGGTYWVTGLTSWGDENCAQFGVNTRVDAMLTWINQQIGATTQPNCTANGVCNAQCTTTPDPDCQTQTPDCSANGVCNNQCTTTPDPDCAQPVDDCDQNNICAAKCATHDPDCADIGEACTSGTECDQRLCVGDPQHKGKYCSQSCKASTDCPAGMECSTGTTKACILKQLPTKKLGETCKAGTNVCEAGSECVQAGAESYCYVVCATDDDCSQEETCQKVSSGKKVCGEAPASSSSSSGATTSSSSSSSTSSSSSGGTVQTPQSNTATTTTSGCNSNGGAPIWLALFVVPFLRRRRV